MNEISRRALELGRIGEELAAAALEAHGLEIVERNVRTPFGEIDIVARDRDGLVFVEVKTRSSAGAGQPYDAVDRPKRERMDACACAFLEQRVGV